MAATLIRLHASNAVLAPPLLEAPSQPLCAPAVFPTPLPFLLAALLASVSYKWEKQQSG
jgi:hypothetical protein